MNDLKYLNGLLLSQNNLLIDCCCDITPETYYWEAVPCDAVLGVASSSCGTNDACAMHDSKYIHYNAKCDGEARYICECQLLKIYDYRHIEFGEANNVFSIEITDPSYPTGIVTLTDTNLVLTLYDTNNVPTGTTIDFTGYYKSLDSLNQDLNNIGLWSGDTQIDYAFASSVYGLIPTGFEIHYGQTKYFKGHSRYKIALGDNVSDWFYLTSGTINPLLQELGDFTSVGSGNVSGYLLDDGPVFGATLPRWHLDFNGSGICGQEFPAITEYKNGVISRVGGFPNNENHTLILIDGNYQYTNVDDGDDYLDHRILGSGMYDVSTPCPFSKGEEYNIIRDYGFRCCPQKGCIIGPDQFIGPTGGTVYNLDDLSILERTFYHEGRCYYPPSYFYLYHILGRFVPTMIEPDITPTGNSLPTNSSVRLFMVAFNQELPWGGFGGYCANLENRDGPCGDNGSHYRPIGTIKTEGEWLQTRNIWIKFKFYEGIPFTDECDSGTYASYLDSFYDSDTADRHDPAYPAIQRVAGEIDSGTLGSFTVIDSGASNSWYYTLKYNVSGKTVNDFIEDLNNIKTLITHSGGTQTQGCSVFAACSAYPESESISLNLVNNASSDLFELGLKCHFTNGAYMPFEDGNEKVSSDIFLPKSYITTFPTVNNNGSTEELPSVSRPYLYSTIPANLPPKNRILYSLPNKGCQEIGFNNGPTQWYQNLQLYEDITASIYKNSLPNYYTSLTATMVTGVLTIIATSGATAFSGIVNTNKDGSGYRIVDFINACTGFSINDGSNTFFPITANSGVQPFDIWLDDATWASGLTEAYPTYPYSTGSFKTAINYAYKEPFLDITGAVELINGQRMDLSCVLRRRSWSFVPSGIGTPSGYFITDLPDAISTTNKLGKIINLDCTRDTVEDRSWIIYYGCTSPVCKTQWYYEAEHCGCSQVWGYNGGDDSDSGGGDGTISALLSPGDCGSQPNPFLDTISYPTIYVCEDNIHPLYTKPILLKSPLQIIDETSDSNCPSDYWQKYNDLDESPITISYDDSDNQGESGWCQYIRPGITPKVKHEDIPREYPATAYINDKQCKPWYPSKPYLLTAFDTYESISVLPHYPPEYINPDDGLPCNTSFLNAYIRAAISPFYGYEWEYNWQGFGDCQRIDVDCTLNCCGCFFLPEVSGSECCLSDGPFSCNCNQTITYERTEVDEVVTLCCSTMPITERCPGAGCNYPAVFIPTKWIADGKITITTTSNGSLTYHYGCCPCEGTIDTDQTIQNNIVCNGDYYDQPVWDCCGSAPEPPSGYYNCAGNTYCLPDEPTTQDCGNIASLDPIVSTSSYSDDGCVTNEGTCDNNLDGVPESDPADVSNYKYVITQDDVYGVDICGVGTNTRTYTNTIIYSGTAGPGDAPCVNGRELGWHSANPNVYHETLESTLDLSITYGPINCANCNFQIGGAPDYDTFVSMVSNLQNNLVCGNPSY